MNARRGLLRLWLVLSAAFVVVVAVVNEPKLDGEFSQAAASRDASAAADEAATEARRQRTARIEAFLGPPTESGWAAGTPKDILWHREHDRPTPAKRVNPTQAGPAPSPAKMDIYRQARRDVWTTGAVAFGTPLMALGFGFGLWWALAGFGRRGPLPPEAQSD
jgi:hypothetical protein